MSLLDAPLDSDDQAVLAELGSLRNSIDNIDAALIHMLAERFKATQKVGELKAAHGLPPADPGDADLDPVFAEKWFNFVVAEVIQHHRRIASDAAGA
jgi:chorismate mutase